MCHPVALVGLSNRPRHFTRMRNSSGIVRDSRVNSNGKPGGRVLRVAAGRRSRPRRRRCRAAARGRVPACGDDPNRRSTGDRAGDHGGATSNWITNSWCDGLAIGKATVVSDKKLDVPKSIPLSARAYPAPAVEGAKNPIAIGVPHPLRQSTARLRRVKSAGLWALDSLILEFNPSTACASQGLRPRAWP
jgi:hypothetical protein